MKKLILLPVAIASYMGLPGVVSALPLASNTGSVNNSLTATAESTISSGIPAVPDSPVTPSGGWSVAFADDFNAPLGTGKGQDNLWYPNQPYSPIYSNANGNNTYETEVYNGSQVNVSAGDLILTARYSDDVAPAGGGYVQRNYGSGLAATDNDAGASGYKDFTWTPGGGETWAFEIDCQFPVNTYDNFNAFWSSSVNGWVNERDFFEGQQNNPNNPYQSGVIDAAWLYNPGVAQEDYESPTTLGFNPATSMHRYTYVIYPNQSWSLYIDGTLQTWVGNNGLAPAESSQNVPMELLVNYALTASNFTMGTRQFIINSIAVYEDKNHAGKGISGVTIAPGTTVTNN